MTILHLIRRYSNILSGTSAFLLTFFLSLFHPFALEVLLSVRGMKLEVITLICTLRFGLFLFCFFCFFYGGEGVNVRFLYWVYIILLFPKHKS